MLAPPPESVAWTGYILIESNVVVADALLCAVYHHCHQFGLLGWKGGSADAVHIGGAIWREKMWGVILNIYLRILQGKKIKDSY